MNNPFLNWQCVCGKGPSIEHQVNGYCSARLVIELQTELQSLKEALRVAVETLKNVREHTVEPFLTDKWVHENHMIAAEALSEIERLVGK